MERKDPARPATGRVRITGLNRHLGHSGGGVKLHAPLFIGAALFRQRLEQRSGHRKVDCVAGSDETGGQPLLARSRKHLIRQDNHADSAVAAEAVGAAIKAGMHRLERKFDTA